MTALCTCEAADVKASSPVSLTDKKKLGRALRGGARPETVGAAGRETGCPSEEKPRWLERCCPSGESGALLPHTRSWLPNSSTASVALAAMNCQGWFWGAIVVAGVRLYVPGAANTT
jgi:hypothetical protein